MKHVMIDFETLATSPNAAVIQIGGVYFDPENNTLGEQFKTNVNWNSLTGELDPNTIKWWLGQSDAARASILDTENTKVMDETRAFREFNDFLMRARSIWSHATFDFVILTNTLKRLGIKPSFSYKAGKDIRTLTHLANLPKQGGKREGVHHDALDDCKFQVQYCVECIKTLKGANNAK